MNWYRLGNRKEQNLAERAKTLSFQSVLFEYKERDLKRKGWVGGCILIMIDVLACDMRTKSQILLCKSMKILGLLWAFLFGPENLLQN